MEMEKVMIYFLIASTLLGGMLLFMQPTATNYDKTFSETFEDMSIHDQIIDDTKAVQKRIQTVNSSQGLLDQAFGAVNLGVESAVAGVRMQFSFLNILPGFLTGVIQILGLPEWVLSLVTGIMLISFVWYAIRFIR